MAYRKRSSSPSRAVLTLFTVCDVYASFARKALTLHLAGSEGHERYFGCNLMHRKVLESSHQHLMAEAPHRTGSSARRTASKHAGPMPRSLPNGKRSPRPSFEASRRPANSCSLSTSSLAPCGSRSARPTPSKTSTASFAVGRRPRRRSRPRRRRSRSCLVSLLGSDQTTTHRWLLAPRRRSCSRRGRRLI